MVNFEEQSAQTLLEHNQITKQQFEEIKDYRALNLFSVHNELKFLLYLSILLFTTGVGILIYQNIDTIGHTVLLGLLLIMTLVCFYFCFKNHEGFKKGEVPFSNPLYDYLVLTAVILSCSFVGYLQFQYEAFGTHYGLATIIPTVISLFCGYYFDNKSVLSIGITGMAAYLGLSVDPKHYFENEMFNNRTLSYIGLAFGLFLLLWSLYSIKINLKKHFNLVYLSFSLHLIGIACIVNLCDDFWFPAGIIMAIAAYYFYNLSFQTKSMSLFIFTVLYGFIGMNIFFVRIIDLIHVEDFLSLFLVLTPFYFIGSILGFIKLIKHFNKKTSNDSL
ncbi:DUF2157 domain-containing protein [Flavobacterium sp. I-SCBP12n]|uniref:DUF2157 domain-containing protein n=2 Tax=Flavobacterium TaxID=237 RepID=A0A9X1XPQ9_9FLAO|nr:MULTISPECIES: DUF2157 domain-containing protein [Flavobacterium]MBP4142465.1 DUF2157 domain-containing protein [Flavobacterium flabelliforme]MCK8140819.1 DUF2157 domain-containing protein [Flavobacterium pygoscelis]